MPNIKNTNVTVMVSSMDAAIRFYTETLGLKLKSRYGDHWADIEGPGIAIGLHPAGKDLITGNNLQIGSSVDDLDSAVAQLDRKGIKLKLNNDGQLRLASFADPDGNTLYLVQPNGDVRMLTHPKG